MKFGHFDDAKREYVITTPKTPYPWINYLGSEKFFSLISNTSGGYSFYTDARLRRLTRYRYNDMPLDNNGSDVFFKVGPAVSWFKVDGDTDRKLGAVAGVGGQWAVNDALAIRAGYDFFFKTAKSEDSSDKINTGLLYLAIVWFAIKPVMPRSSSVISF